MVNVLNCDLIALMLFTLTQGDSYFPFLPYSCFPITPIFIVGNYLSFFAPPDNHIMQRARLIESWTSRQASTLHCGHCKFMISGLSLPPLIALNGWLYMTFPHHRRSIKIQILLSCCKIIKMLRRKWHIQHVSGSTFFI